ncbi:MAG: nucleotidyltransferase family protein [Terriglobales bacterium]
MRPSATTPVLTPEEEVCLLLARGRLTPEERTRVLQLLASPLQWPLILERALSHQVHPLIYRNLRKLDFPGVPEHVQAELKGLFLANALRNQLQSEELARLLGLLGEAGIRVVPLKGVALAQSLYDDVAARVCGDIDILVPPANVAQAIDLLLHSGYRTEAGDPYLSKLALRHGRHFNLVREGRGISFVLELHWILVQHSSKDKEAVNDLWAEARPHAFFAAPAFAMSAEWQMLYLSLHAADHDWQMLKWLVDIHNTVLRGEIDWPKATAKAERFELSWAMRHSLAVTSLLLGTKLPANFLPSDLPERMRIFPQSPLPENSPETTLAFRHLRVLARPLDKLGYFATGVFAPKSTDLEWVRLPRRLAFLYYFVRPLRLAGKWVRRAAGKKQV